MVGRVVYLYCGVGNHLRGDLLDFVLRQEVLLSFCLLGRCVIAAYLLVLDSCFIAEEAGGNLARAAGQGLDELNVVAGLTRART